MIHFESSDSAFKCRRGLLFAALGLLTPFEAGATGRAAMTVWKSPTCGCCKDWVAHIEAAGMDGEIYGARKDPYDVLLVLRDETFKVFQIYR